MNAEKAKFTKLIKRISSATISDERKQMTTMFTGMKDSIWTKNIYI